MIPATIAIGGLKEGILVALLFIGINLYKDKTETDPLPLANDTESVIIHSKGTYFCPFYCGARHVHRAHTVSYSCGLENCHHFTVKTDSLNNIFKVKKSCR